MPYHIGDLKRDSNFQHCGFVEFRVKFGATTLRTEWVLLAFWVKGGEALGRMVTYSRTSNREQVMTVERRACHSRSYYHDIGKHEP